MNPSDLADDVIELERKLLAAPWRSDPGFLEEALADDFHEIGQSGRFWSKTSIMDDLLKASENDLVAAEDFVAHSITENVVIIRYRTRAPGKPWVHRSSLWRWQDRRWQIIFHQGTPVLSGSQPA